MAVASGGTGLAGSIGYNEGYALDTYPTFTPLAASPGYPEDILVAGSQADEDALWELTGLGAGTPLIASFASPNPVSIYIYSDAGLTLLAFAASSPAEFGSITIPASGDLFFEIRPVDGEASNFSVTVSLEATAVPEPSAIATAGLGLAGGLALGRKRRKPRPVVA